MNIITKLMALIITCCFVFASIDTRANDTSIAIQSASAYEMMEVVFIGKPKKATIQPLLEAVMKKYSLPVTEENLLRTSSALVSLRKSSAVGVTEMEILKHMYQQGPRGDSFANQAGMSSALLELTK